MAKQDVRRHFLIESGGRHHLYQPFIKGKIPVQLKDQYPEVEDYLRLNIENAASITIGEKRFDPISIVRADPSFPRFFPYKVVAGDINKALTQPNAIALTEYQAKIF